MEMRGVPPNMIDAKSLVLTLDNSRIESLPKVVLERCVSYYRGTNIATVFESHGIEVINSSRVLNLCGNKSRDKSVSREAWDSDTEDGRCILFRFSDAGRRNSRLSVRDEANCWQWGRQVVPVRDRETAEALIEMREQSGDSMQSVYYIQEMIRRPPRDIRCIAVGNEIVACVYRYAASESWKTNVALGGHTEPCTLTSQLEELLLKTVSVVGEGVLGIDVMERGESDSQEYVIHEVNGTVEFKGAQMATEQSIAGCIADYLTKPKREMATL